MKLVFTPHLTPMIRGIHATLYARLTATADLQALFERRYANEPFVDVMPAGSHPETRSVRGANVCRIAVHQPQGGDTAVVLSVIDNLVKGASGQAVQNMNIMFGLPETTRARAGRRRRACRWRSPHLARDQRRRHRRAWVDRRACSPSSTGGIVRPTT